MPDVEPTLVLGIGSGRNLPPFLDTGRHFFVADESETNVSFFTEREPHIHAVAFRHGRLALADAGIGSLLATHIFQHGTYRHIASLVAECARVCKANAPVLLVFASREDARFGQGHRIEEACYAPTDGDEIGVAHRYFHADEIRTLLAERYVIERIEHVHADMLVGSWAHTAPSGMRHYFVFARRNGS